MLRRLFLLSLPIMALTAAPAGAKEANVLSQTITDEAIVFPESFETDTQKLMEGWYMKNYTATDTRYLTEPDVRTSDAEMRKRLKALPTVIDMPFNQIVRSYIERYTDKGRAQVAALLGLNIYYSPIFEQALEEEGLPLELKYLPVIESGLNPNAVSRHGASGLWQFMLGTAKGLGLEVNSLVDMRRDPYASSKVAAKYLKDLYSSYNDWSLAIAAYNCGPGTVNKAIRRAGGDPKKHDFWSIYNYLPAETRGYVPMFIAANYVMNYYKAHNISPVLPTKPLVTDTIGVPYRVHFDQISSVLNIPKEELRVLNPQFRADVIPGSAETSYSLILPSQQIHAYIMSENDIRNYEAERYARRDEATPGVVSDEKNDGQPAAAEVAENTEENTAELTDADNEVAEEVPAAPAREKGVPSAKRHTVTHKVAQGETLAQIAELYDVTPAEIRQWNSLRRNAVRPGQLLRVETAANSQGSREQASNARRQSTTQKQQPAPTQKQSSKKRSSQKQSKKAQPKTTNHTVASGETLSSIAKRHGVTVEEIKKANSGMGDMIHPGDKVKIPSKVSKKSSRKKGSGSKKSSRKKRRR